MSGMCGVHKVQSINTEIQFLRGQCVLRKVELREANCPTPTHLCGSQPGTLEPLGTLLFPAVKWESKVHNCTCHPYL